MSARSPRQGRVVVDLDVMDALGLAGNERLIMAYVLGREDAGIVTAAELRRVTGQSSAKGAWDTIRRLEKKGMVSTCEISGRGRLVVISDLADRVARMAGGRDE